LQDRAQENFHFEQFRQSYPKKREANAEKYFCVTTCNVRRFFVGCKKKPKEGTENGMRVITGSARGRRLNELKGYDTRPTTDKVKEGIFSAIQFEVEGARVLDLFAGTGQLGIEALSRGAQRAVFVDRRTDAVKLIRENLALTRLEEGAQVVCGDSMAYLNALREKFDLIFLDPPYADDLLERAVAHIARFDILAPDGIMIAESPAEKELPKLSAPYRVAREYRYGRIKVTLYRRDGEETT
jgi:RNA methyltransferase, rsmD family